MKNINFRDEDFSETMLEELYLADIPAIKVDDKYIGRIGNWTLIRRSTYWSAAVENERDGLTLEDALILHNKKRPPLNKYCLGGVIRSGGHGGAPSPDKFGADVIFDDKLREQMKSLENKYGKMTFTDVLEYEKKGEIIIEKFVNCYHIDTQIGLNEFSKFIKNNINKNVFIKLIDERIEARSGGEEMKSLNESFTDGAIVRELEELKTKIKNEIC
jgi:hypothetical protein